MTTVKAASEPLILILSTPTDGHLPYVTKHLLPHEYILMDVQAVPAKKGLSYHIATDGRVTITYRGQSLHKIRGVWFRRPIPVKDLQVRVEKRFESYVRSALDAHVSQLYTLFPEARWMSDPYIIRRANNKFFQLRTAANVGLHVPRTLFTSDSEAASQFLASQEATIVKSLANRSPADALGNPHIMLATKIKPSDKPDFSGLHLAPSIFQQAIPHKSDIRVTVIGRQVFAASIDLKNVKEHPRTRDWRLGYMDGELEIKPFTLPSEVEKQCIRLVQVLGLSYGAIDLVQDTSGRLWFLEINPNGQWAFVEKETDQPMGEAVANYLRGK